MLTFTTSDAVSVLKKSRNLNAALKTFLKREVKPGDSAARVVKGMRDLVDAVNTTRLESYVEKMRGAYDPHLLGIGKYAHQEMVDQILVPVAEKYAEEFNSTYVVVGEKIEVKNQKRFDEIVADAMKMITGGIREHGFADSVFLKGIVVSSIFDRPVLAHIMESGKI